MIASTVLPVSGSIAAQPEPAVTGTVSDPKPADQPRLTDYSSNRTLFKAVVRALVEKEVKNTSLPADVADAVVHVESDYNPATIGGVGEIGLMQIQAGNGGDAWLQRHQ